MKKILLITILSFILLFSLYSSNDKSKDFNIFSHCYKCDGTTYPLPPGLSEINITWWGGWRNAYLLTPENILKYSYDQTAFIKKIFDNKHVPFDFNNVNKIVEGAYRLTNKAWWDALKDLKKCESFINAQNGIPYNEFINYLKKNSFPLEFDNQLKEAECFAYTLSNSKNQKMMRWPHSTLGAIINYLIDNSFELTNYKSNQTLKDYYNYIAHEMLHMYTDFYDHPSGKSVTPDDCEINCILKSCGFSVEVKSECNELCYKGYCQKNTYEPCKPKGSGGGSDNRDDWADDNYSSAYGYNETSNLDDFNSLLGFSGYISDTYGELAYSYYPDILIYNKYNFDEMEKLLNRSQVENYIDDYEHIDFSNEHKVLVVPSGELMGERDSELIKLALGRFVENGGTLIVFGQQYGEDVDKLVPIPDGECLQSYGWRQDQSCYNGSLYFKDMHPALSGLTYVRPTAGVDGYFPVYPSSSTILLRRISNEEPALLYYPYGNGTVILTSLYTDFGLAHSQASREELRMVRDLITFAKNPKLDIPMFNLATNSRPAIGLTATIRNTTKTPAAKIKLRISTPDRTRVLYESEQALALDGGAETTLPINFDLPTLTNTEYGICHTDYELFAESGEIIQLAQESDEGRFAVYQYSGSVNISRPLTVWITTAKEEWEWDEQGIVTIHIRNNTNNAITTDWYYQWNHQGHYVLPETTIAAHSQVDLPISADWPTWNTYGSQQVILFRLNYKQKDQSGDYSSIGKGLTVNLAGKGSININAGSTSYKIGAPVGYSLSIYNSASRAYAGVNLRVALEEKRWIENDFNEIKTIYQVTHNFGAKETFRYNGSYVQDSGNAHPAGLYRLKLEITWPSGNKQYSYYLFSYVKSNISINLIEAWPTNTTRYLQYGQSYPFSFSINNAHFHWHDGIPVSNGKCIFSVVAETGEEAFHKEFTGLSIADGATISFAENYIFLPPTAKRYKMKVQYEDETGTSIEFEGKYNYFFKIVDNIYIENKKEFYNFGDTIDLKVGLRGVGSYHITVNCPREGYSAEKDITFSTETGDMITESFSIPATLSNAFINSFYTEISINIKSNDASCISTLPGMCSVTKSISFRRQNVKMESWGKFDDISAKAGEPISFHLGLRSLSGFALPTSGLLTISSSGFGFSDSQTVVVTPGIDNLFDYQIPVSESIAAGYYTVYAWFEVEGRRLISQSYSIFIPSPGMRLSEPSATIAAGMALPLDFVNDGGKDGNYTFALTLMDELGKVMLTHADTQAIVAGGTYHLDLPLPDGLKSGKYTLKQAVGETVSGKSFALQSGITISGLTATLNAFTLKPAYFDNETVAGKAEIVAGGTLNDGTLKARIFKTKRGGIKVFEASQYSNYEEMPVWYGKSFANKTYFVTEMGLVEFDRSTGKYAEVLNRQDLDVIYITPEGELWLATYDNGSGNGVMRRNLAGVWTNYTTNEGLLNNEVWDFIEYDNGGQKAIWIATASGISVFSNNQWSSYTTANGLSANNIFEFAKDSAGEIWVWSEGGIDRFNGTSFETAALPFDQSGSYSYYDMIPTTSGNIWFEVTNYDANWALQSSYLWRYTQGSWSSWDLLTSIPNTNLYEFSEDDGELWFMGYKSDDGSYVVGKFDGTFSIISSSDAPEVADCSSIIPVPGSAEIYFGSNPGFIEFNGDMWQKRLIEIEGEENELRVNNAYLLVDDKQGGVWLAGETEIAHFQDENFTNYSTEDADNPWSVDSLTVGPDGSAYALNYIEGYNNASESYILRITESGTSQIPFPVDFYSRNNQPVVGTDANGRLWLGENRCPEGCMVGKIFYYDGEWHALEAEAWVQKFVSDGAGGVWIAGGSGGWFEGKLIHVQGDLTVQEYSSYDSELAYNSVEDIYRDASGVLWILSKQRIQYTVNLYPELFAAFEAEAVQTFENGVFTLKAASASAETTPGYPTGGIWSIAEAEDGNIVFAGRDTTNIDKEFRLYWLSGQEMLADENVFYTPYSYNMSYGYYDAHPFVQHIVGSGALIYALGDIEYSGEIVVEDESEIVVEHNLLQMGANMQKVQVWSNEYALNAASGEALNIDLLPEMTLAAGNYTLSTELTSALDQKLAASDYGFIVRGTAVAASISKSDAADPNVRAGMDQEVQFEVLNGTAEDKPALTLKVTKLSPAGVETVLQEGPLSLNAGQSHNGAFTFNESEIGIWQLNVEVGESDTLLDGAELILMNSEPAIAYEIVYPEYAGVEAFPVKIKMTNSGKITTNVHVNVGATGGSPSYLDENVALVPGEERILSFTDTITVDRVYDIVFTGDLEASEQKTVAYGYVGNLALSVLPQYREGIVTMGYTVANAGGLPFGETIHFGLYLPDTETVLYAVDKTYNLYPGAEPFAEALEFPLVPGAYQLRWTSAKSGVGQIDFSILPAGIGRLAFAPAAKTPVGLTDFAYTLTNTDSVAGSIDLLIEIVPAAGGTAVYSLHRSHYLEAGASAGDNFSFDFAQTGEYVVRIGGAKVTGGTFSVPFKVLNLDEVTTSVAVQPAGDGTVPVQVNIINSGYNDFAGTLVIEAGGLRHEESIQVISQATLNQTYGFDANGLSSGSQEVSAYLYDAAGNLLSQHILTVTIQNADIRVMDVPQDLTIAAGSFADVTIKVRNQGNKRGEAAITVTAFDNLNETRTLVLEAGEELELSDIYIDVDGDIPAGRYPFNYTLSGLGVSNGLVSGNFTFQVSGIALNVAATLDRSLYNQGETALLTIDVSSAEAVSAPLEAVVNWNDFSERRTFTLDNGSSSLVFEIPLSEASDAKVFYGIYQEEGRGIYLNDIYLNFAGGVSVTLDQQVYAPGDSVHALFTVGEAGSLTAECFGQSQTIIISSSGSVNFSVPADALGGSYGVAWTFTPTDVAHEPASGSKAFDVSGLVVKVARAELERGKYAPGDTIKAMLTLESNRDISLALRSWTVTPEAQWTYLGEQSATLSAAQQTPAVLQYAFATSEAGTHRFVYGLYNGEQLVVSGAAAFDCGDAVLIGLAPDHLEYPLGSETVRVKADYFGNGTATLQLYLDDVVIETRSITLAGLGATEIDLAAAQVPGGRHDLRAVMTKDGLTSTRRAWFTYGTSLPDLAVGMSERTVNGLDYVFMVQVSNGGKTAAPATTLIFSDNDSDMQSAAIAALAPGAAQDAQFTWSGSGKAGSHVLAFTVDRDNAIKEFAEGNNVLEMTEEVPILFYNLSIDPQVWTANRSVSIFSRFINNQANDLPLALHLTLTHNASSQIILERNKNISLAPFVQTVETDYFNTGIYPAGDYTLAQTASGGAVERTEELSVYIEPTRAISGTMTIVPTMIAAGIDTQITLKLALSNIGNVALESEALTVEVAKKESQEVVKTDSLAVSLALAENKTVDHILALNLAEGIYAVTVKHGEQTIAEGEITAAMGLEKEKYVSRRPRLLFMNTVSIIYQSQKNFLKAILSAAGISYQDSHHLIDSYAQLQKNEHAINVVFGKLATPSMKKELKERVHRGEGLIHFVDNPASDAIMEALCGVRARTLLPALREKEITLLPGALGNSGAALLKNKCKLGLEVLADDVVAVAETKNGKKIVAALRPYGNGKILTICLPLEFTSGGAFAQLLLNAVQLLNNDVFSPSDLARVLPLELRIRNNTGVAKTFRVKELLPQAVSAYGFNPLPLEGEGSQWDIQLAVDEEKVISYWLRLPDAIGVYDIKSEIYEGGQKVDEALLSFEVGQKVADRVVGIAAEISAGSDAQAKLALPLLQRIAGRSGDDVVSLWLNLVDAVQATDLVADSDTAEASAWRQSLQNVMLACARMFFEKIKDFSPLELNAFGTRFGE